MPAQATAACSFSASAGIRRGGLARANSSTAAGVSRSSGAPGHDQFQHRPPTLRPRIGVLHRGSAKLFSRIFRPSDERPGPVVTPTSGVVSTGSTTVCGWSRQARPPVVSAGSTTDGALAPLDHRRPGVVSTGSTTELRRGLDRLDHRVAACGLDGLDHRGAAVVSTSSTTEAGSPPRGGSRRARPPRALGVVSTGSTTESTVVSTGSTTEGCTWSRQARPPRGGVPAAPTHARRRGLPTRGRSRGTGILERVTSLDPAIAGRLKRSADGLVPAVAQQHDTGEVLMLGWMDDEALARTLTTGRATYWSRSRGGVLGQGRHLRPRPVGQGGPARLRRRHPARPGRPGGRGLPHGRPHLLRRRRAARTGHQTTPPRP